MQFNSVNREITIKVVYYGPPMSGKTSNLHAIHMMLNDRNLGHLTVLDTSDDRTLFFDLLPISSRLRSGNTIKLKLFTVPGQVIHAATRRVVLSGADGVVFVADGQRTMGRLNNEFFRGMRRYLADNQIDPDDTPTVIQFNKMDLPDVRSDEEIEQIRQRGVEPVFRAVAIRGEGVLETLHGMLELVFSHLNKRYDFNRKFEFSSEEFFGGLFGHLQSKGALEGAEK
ncbi:MAG: hypothetical protein A2289_16375 [Deltaproteobacteria bacterium RIFOXYA12_FULL_58_15]|nr:MAG: hypothetical protein A2289_16375 [Deltaproteobacteria bacterium RIFOXYA12_FULL_58_15]